MYALHAPPPSLPRDFLYTYILWDAAAVRRRDTHETVWGKKKWSTNLKKELRGARGVCGLRRDDDDDDEEEYDDGTNLSHSLALHALSFSFARGGRYDISCCCYCYAETHTRYCTISTLSLSLARTHTLGLEAAAAGWLPSAVSLWLLAWWLLLRGGRRRATTKTRDSHAVGTSTHDEATSVPTYLHAAARPAVPLSRLWGQHVRGSDREMSI